MIYNFRIDKTQVDEILRRLEQDKVICQGWGGGESGTLNICQEDYVRKCREFYGLASTRIPTNLTRMRDLEDGDILVTPHLPSYGNALIHVVDGDFPNCYDYLDKDPNHLNNTVRVKKSYGLDGNINIHNVRLASWYGKLQSLRLPIIPMREYEASFRSIIEELEKNSKAVFGPSKLDEYVERQLSRIIKLLKDELYSISASSGDISFESICEHLLSSAGYTIKDRNVSDGSGGDVDRHCVRERTDLSPFETGETTLYVQVKKHSGTTDKRAVEQLLRMIEKQPEAYGCVMSLADDFSEGARELADRNGILLMNGDQICKLLLKDMVA